MTELHYDAEGRFEGSSQNRGDHDDNFDANSSKIGETYKSAGRLEEYIGGSLSQTKYQTDWGFERRGPSGEYLGCDHRVGSELRHYGPDGDNAGSSYGGGCD